MMKVIGTVVAAFVVVIGTIFLVSLLCAIPVYFLWNWLCPVLFGLPQITLMQSMGLLLLSGLLFSRSTSTPKSE